MPEREAVNELLELLCGSHDRARVSIVASEPAEQGERSFAVRVATRLVSEPVA